VVVLDGTELVAQAEVEAVMVVQELQTQVVVEQPHLAEVLLVALVVQA
jgi:hypothetical protein